MKFLADFRLETVFLGSPIFLGSLILLGSLSLTTPFSSKAFADECVDDSAEPNNGQQMATSIEADQTISMHSCLYDDDYFSIDLDTGSVVTITTTSQLPTGDLDLYFLSVDASTLLASSLQEGSDESITQYYVPEAGTYYIKTSLFTDSQGTGIPYDLNVTIEDVESCTDDTQEDNDSWNNTKPIGNISDVSLFLSICPDDEDWFSFELQRHEQITVTVDFSHDNGDIDIYLKDINNNILATSDTINDQEVLVFLPEEQAEYKLQITLFSENDNQLGNTYTLQTMTEIVNPCGEDDYDPNESIESATPIEETTLENLISCDADWFAIEATEGMEIQVTLNFLHQLGDLDLSLYDNEQEFILSAASGNDNEELKHIAAYTGTHYVEVSLVDNLTEGNPYSLTYSQTEPIIVQETEPSEEPTSDPVPQGPSCQTLPKKEISAWFLILFFGFLYRKNVDQK